MTFFDHFANSLERNRITRRQALWLLGAGAAGASLSGCATSPVTGKSILVDALGFLLFFPPFRNLIWSWAVTRIRFTATVDGFADRFETNDYNNERQNGRGSVYDLDPEDYESHEPDENGVLEDSTERNHSSRGASPWRKR